LLMNGFGARWQAPLERGHPLVGKIWDAKGGHFILPEELVGHLSDRRLVLLGEKHDNPDHHRIQGWIIRGLVAGGRRPAVAFEMFSPDQLPAIEAARETRPRDAEHLAEAAGWDKTGWPDFALYRPIVEAVLDGGLQIRSANLSRTELSELRAEGIESLESAFVERFALARPLPEAQQAALATEIRDAHCGHASEEVIGSMVLVQRVRDATMAQSLLTVDGAQRVVLIAGTGHARKDRGVPAYLALEATNEQISSVGIVEVVRDVEDAARYVAGDGDRLFDFLWFTPRIDDLDPCEKYREQLEKMKTGARNLRSGRA
jgi:uncharacterized iron-regulated protein